MENNWVKDDRGNRCSVEYFGSEEAARAALASLKNCENCINCSGCSDCSHCSRCSGCSDCSRCSGCSDCSRCSRCSRCSDCSRCSGCSDCSGCSGCSRCSDCWRCSDCSGCSRCSGCSGCSHVANLDDRRDLVADPSAGPYKGAPVIPTIDRIHARVLEAVSDPGALKMDSWHTCNTTHCRAGWVVHLAGEQGYEAEKFYGTALAAQLIYRESNPDMPVSPVRFYETNEVALADIKRMAEAEATQAALRGARIAECLR